MRGASIVIQTAWRGFACRQKRQEAARKELEGARVDVVYKRGRVVSGTHLFLEVKRCGLSFKFIGRSESHMETFFGYVYREDCLRYVERHNEMVRMEVARLGEIEGRDFRSKYKGYDRSKESDDVKAMHDMQALMKRGVKAEALKAQEVSWVGLIDGAVTELSQLRTQTLIESPPHPPHHHTHTRRTTG